MEKERVLESVLRYLEHRDLINSEPFMKSDSEVPVSGGKLTYSDIVNLVDAALDGWITEGKWADRFRKSLCSYTGYHHAVLANSGSSANLLALSGVIEKYKSQYHGLVITSALAFPTTVAPILQAGLIPCFVDIELNTLNPSAYSVEQAMKLRHPIVGVMIAHTMGIPFPIKEIDALCKEREIFLIQDTCDALGARTGRGERLSEYGDAATLSFFPAHQITTGEGGAVLTNDGRLFSAIRSYANWGRDCWCEPGEENTCGKRFDQKFDDLPDHYDHKYVFSRIGFNMKMTELQAALGMEQMARIINIVRERRSHYQFLFDNFSVIPNFGQFFRIIDYKALSSPFGFPIYVKGIKREEIVNFLEKRNIKTRPLFSGNITHQPMMKSIPYDQVTYLPNCERVMNDMFWIGCHPELSQDQLDYVVESFADFVGQRS